MSAERCEFRKKECCHALLRIAVENEANLEDVERLMTLHFPHAKESTEDHPVLHQACGQHYRGATLILYVAWNSPDWRPLFADVKYLDKYRRCAYSRLKLYLFDKALKQMRKGDPDVTTLRDDICDYAQDKLRRDRSPERKKT